MVVSVRPRRVAGSLARWTCPVCGLLGGQSRHRRAQRLRCCHGPGRGRLRVKKEDGRRNRYHIQAHLALPEPAARERAVEEMLALLTGTDATVTGQQATAGGVLIPALAGGHRS